MKAAVILFPGSNCDTDCFNVLRDVMKWPTQFVWHKEGTLPSVDLVVLPGGFSYGDYLRTGAIARFSPIMKEVRAHIAQGKPAIGICNGFQILLEAGELPGAMLRNKTLAFVCRDTFLKAENTRSVFTKAIRPEEILRIPVAHGEGNYYCDDETLKMLEAEGRVAFRYCSEAGVCDERSNPNGSRSNIAGILNARGNVLGMMPHPERASEKVLGSEDGRKIWESFLR
ncbi:MAG: phosphoribosylformylglycinamidine synthase subunit PurQ [Candidatus Omnitrophota bacterium]